jgi:hypothetical protein
MIYVLILSLFAIIKTINKMYKMYKKEATEKNK